MMIIPQNIFRVLLLVMVMIPAVRAGNSAERKNPGQVKPVVGLGLGNEAPEIFLKNPSDSLMALSSFRGKVVLLDFWASWCGPCRIDNRALVKIYNEYREKEFTKGKGFTVFSVSLDSDRENWKKAIEKDELSWKGHVSDLKMWGSEVVTKYNIESIPCNLLLNEQGIIIEKNLKGKKLESALKKMLINK